MYFLCPKCLLNVLDGQGVMEEGTWGEIEGGRGREGKGQNNIFKYYTFYLSEQVSNGRGGPLWNICLVPNTSRPVSLRAKRVVYVFLCNQTIKITEIYISNTYSPFLFTKQEKITNYRMSLFYFFHDQHRRLFRIN